MLWAADVANDPHEPAPDVQPPPLAPWFNLETESTTDLSVHFVSDVAANSLFADISTSLRHLHVRLLGTGDDCFSALRSLTVYPLFPGPAVAEHNPITIFPDLYTLDLRALDVSPLLAGGLAHDQLTTLSVGAINPVAAPSAFRPTHPTRASITELCRIKKDKPDRFPALSRICLHALAHGFSPPVGARPASRRCRASCARAARGRHSSRRCARPGVGPSLGGGPRRDHGRGVRAHARAGGVWRGEAGRRELLGGCVLLPPPPTPSRPARPPAPPSATTD